MYRIDRNDVLVCKKRYPTEVTFSVIFIVSCGLPMFSKFPPINMHYVYDEKLYIFKKLHSLS